MDSKKIQVNYQNVLRLKEELRSINKHGLENIEWVDDAGRVIRPSSVALEEFRFTGLNTTDFPELYPQEFTNK